MTPLADAHLHLFHEGFRGRYGRRTGELETYERFREAHGIAAGLVVAYEGEGIDPHNNAHVRTLAATRGWISSVAYLLPEARPDARQIDELLVAGHVGIALYLPNAEAAAAAIAWPEEAWQRLSQHGAIVSLNAPPPAIATFAPIVERWAGCTFLFSHLGLPGRQTSIPSLEQARGRLEPLLALARFPNTMVKISGLYAISDPAHGYPHAAAAPFLTLILERFGPERCCWGSDFSPVLDFLSFAQAVDIPWPGPLSDEERARIMGGNLLALLSRR